MSDPQEAAALTQRLQKWAEGKATLPLIHAIAHSGETTRTRLREIVENGNGAAMPARNAQSHCQPSWAARRNGQRQCKSR